MIIRFGAQASDKQAVWISFKSTPSTPFIFSFLGVYASGSGLHTSYTGEQTVKYNIVASDSEIPEGKENPVSFGVAKYGQYQFTYIPEVDNEQFWRFDGWYEDATLTQKINPETVYTITENKNVYGTYHYYGTEVIDKQYVDVTGTQTDTSFASTHICNDSEHLVNKYDGTYHWQECSICSSQYVSAGRPNDSTWENEYLEIQQNENGRNILVVKNSYTVHNLENAHWLLGDSCSSKNEYISNCSCGYINRDTLKPKPRQHDWSQWKYGGDRHLRMCSYCYENKPGTDYEFCTSGGVRLGCSTGVDGVCDVCQNRVQNRHTVFLHDSEHLGRCRACGKEIFEDDVASSVTYNGNTITLTQTYRLKQALQSYVKDNSTIQSESLPYIRIDNSTHTVSSDRKTVTRQLSLTLLSNVEMKLKVSAAFSIIDHDGDNTVVSCFYEFAPENVTPTISTANSSSSSFGDWATNANITVSGTEAYCSSVTVEMKDTNNDMTIYSGTVAVTGGNYSLTFTPNVSNNETKTYSIVVTDSMGNASTTSLVLQKCDCVTPAFVKTSQIQNINGENIWSTPIPWSKSKDFTITTTDEGSDFVESRIQAVTSTNTGNTFTDVFGATSIDRTTSPSTYTRDYEFTGNVKGYVTIRSDAKDYVNNITTDFFRVYNLDNTNPEISNATYVGSSTSTIMATLSDAHSGIKYFGIVPKGSGTIVYPSTYPTGNITSMSASNINTWYQVPLITANGDVPESGQESIDVSFKVPVAGEYYLITEDYVGNRNSALFNATREVVSEEYEITQIPIQTVDVTGAVTDTSTEVGHVCTDPANIVSKYDETYHWKECAICSPKYVSAGRPDDSTWENEYLEMSQNVAGQRILILRNTRSSHAFSSYNTMGNSCHPSNKKVYTCSCGYSYNTSTGIAHGSTYLNANQAFHVYTCRVCLSEVSERYEHKNSSGQILRCDTGITGYCVTCGLSITGKHEVAANYDTRTSHFLGLR